VDVKHAEQTVSNNDPLVRYTRTGNTTVAYVRNPATFEHDSACAQMHKRKSAKKQTKSPPIPLAVGSSDPLQHTVDSIVAELRHTIVSKLRRCLRLRPTRKQRRNISRVAIDIPYSILDRVIPPTASFVSQGRRKFKMSFLSRDFIEETLGLGP
jgi:hypothetical protein